MERASHAVEHQSALREMNARLPRSSNAEIVSTGSFETRSIPVIQARPNQSHDASTGRSRCVARCLRTRDSDSRASIRVPLSRVKDTAPRPATLSPGRSFGRPNAYLRVQWQDRREEKAAMCRDGRLGDDLAPVEHLDTVVRRDT
jgi:hypothetical protein